VPSAILDLQKFGILTAGRADCVIVPNFAAIGQTVDDVWPFINLFNMTAIHHLAYILPVFGPRRNSIYRFAKFRWNRCSSFDNMPVLGFASLA